MKAFKLLTFIALAAICGGGLHSCTSELDSQYELQKPGKGTTFRAPEVYAWSGKQTFGNAGKTRSTVVERTDRPDFTDWCAGWWPENVPAAYPQAEADAADNYNYGVFAANKSYKLTYEDIKKAWGDDGEGLVALDEIPDGVKLYVESGIWNFFNNSDKQLEIYVKKDAKAIFARDSKDEYLVMKNIKFYNYGALVIQFDYETINEGCEIYNTNYLYVETNISPKENGGKIEPIKINVPIYSNKDAHFGGQTIISSKCYFNQVCVDGKLRVKDNTITCGILTADELYFYRDYPATVELAPDGLLTTGTINIKNESFITGPKSGKLGSILVNYILGARQKYSDEYEDAAFSNSDVTEDNFDDFFKNVNIFVTKTINNWQEEEKILVYQPDGGETFALQTEEFDASADDWLDANRLDCGAGYRYAVVPDEEPDEDDVCDKCGHKHNEDGTCPECQEGDECYPETPGTTEPGTEPTEPTDPTDPTEPATPAETAHNNEVEVNLSIADSHDGYVSKDLAAKLSIHVRKGTDVEIVMPIPEKYKVISDDMEIFTVRPDEVAQKTEHKVEYAIDVNGVTKNVTLTVKLQSDAIVVTTNGIDEELIDYLFEKNGDGINFEVWTYFETEIVDENGDVIDLGLKREDLYNSLNKSTIEFLDDYPDYYIEAFYTHEESNQYVEGTYDHDCAVSIIESQLGDFYYCHEGEHLNGSCWNQIYNRKGVDVEHSAHNK